MATPALLGVDVGFSKSKKTTGLAWFANSTIDAEVLDRFLNQPLYFAFSSHCGRRIPRSKEALKAHPVDHTVA